MINEKYHIEKLRTNDENFPKSVTCITKDSTGFIWFGTHYGLYRFDGYNFKVYSHKNNDNNSINSDNITSICDDNKYLWIGTSHGLNRFEKSTESFKAYTYNPLDDFSISSNRVWAIYLMKSDELWLGTGEGLIKFDKSKDRFYSSKNSSIKFIPESIISFCEDIDGYLWIGTLRGGLIKYDIQNNIFKNYKFDPSDSLSLSNNIVMSIIEINNENIWVATWGGGINKFDKKRELFYRFQYDSINKNSMIHDKIISASKDVENKIWCATSLGLSILDPLNEEFTNLDTRDYPLYLNEISCIYSDHSGITWLYNDCHGDRSINVYSKNKLKFNHYKKNASDNKSLNSNVVVTICEDENENIWIGSDNGIDILNRSKERKNHIVNLGNNYIWNIYRDRKNYMWIATYNDAIERYDPKTGKFTQFYDFDGKGFICHDIFEDKKENLWLGLMKGGVRVFDKNRKLKRRYLTAENGNSEYDQIEIRKIFEDSKENIWLATNMGLALFDQKTDSIYFYKNIPHDSNSINCNKVFSVIEDNEGYIWAGTRNGGLNRFDPISKTFQHFMKNGEPKFYAAGRLLLDNNENIWMVTEKSIAMFNPKNGTFTNYDESDGVQGLTIAGSFKSINGEMFFGGENGFNSFHPDDIPKNNEIPFIVITEFKIFNKDAKLHKSITEIKEITISHKENFFSFGFASLDFTNPGKNQYAYKLDRVDRNWNFVGNKMTASYTNISPGEYIFRVKGTNNDGVWNEEGTSVKLIITPPFHKTAWFNGLSALSVIGGIGMLIRQRFEKIKKEKEQQEEFTRKIIESQENERKRFASELHDGLGQDLIIIKNKAQLSFDRTDEVSKLKEEMKEISELASLTINEAREISQNLRPNILDSLGLTRTLLSMFERAKNSTAINFNIEVDNIDNVFAREVDINVYRILQECLTNTIKHSDSTEVFVIIKKSEKEISILISDNGKGFDVSKKLSDRENKGFGLKGIPERVKLFGGRFNIYSEKGKGTKVRIVLPVTG